MNDLSKKYNTYDKQVVLLRMMKDIDMLFKENNIDYSLCGGTLLGAIRETGFIPWDDDIDIMVDRNNYEKIVDYFDRDAGVCGYSLNRNLWIDRIQRSEDTAGSLYFPTIDVFVMDNCPDILIARKLKVLLIMIMQGMMKKDSEYNDLPWKYKLCLGVTHIMGKPFSDDRKFGWYQAIARLGFNLLNLKYTGKLFDTLVEQQFEDAVFPITAEFDSYLTTQYGDYMTPPDEADRIPHYTE